MLKAAASKSSALSTKAPKRASSLDEEVAEDLSPAADDQSSASQRPSGTRHGASPEAPEAGMDAATAAMATGCCPDSQAC